MLHQRKLRQIGQICISVKVGLGTSIVSSPAR
jgi:hypothetical protein